jgi:hypothetical protein
VKEVNEEAGEIWQKQRQDSLMKQGGMSPELKKDEEVVSIFNLRWKWNLKRNRKVKWVNWKWKRFYLKGKFVIQ